MSVTVKQLQEHQPSPEEQEELAQRANEMTKELLSSFAQQFEDVLKPAFPNVLQYIQEAIKPSFSELFGQKGYFAGLAQRTFAMDERYWKPAYVPPPPYLTERPPIIIKVLIDDRPGLN